MGGGSGDCPFTVAPSKVTPCIPGSGETGSGSSAGSNVGSTIPEGS